MVATYVVLFGTLAWRQHARYATFGFDLGIYDQATWLLSRGSAGLITVRGLDVFAHHATFVLLLFAPFYWAGVGLRALIWGQALAVGLGAVPVWLLARDRLGRSGDRRWLALVPAAAFLLHPAVEWIPWWHVHPESFAITPLLFAWWCATRGRWRWFAVAVALALSTKEDVALAVVGLGLALTLLRGSRSTRRAGLITAVVGLVWFVAMTKLLIPSQLGSDPFYAQQYFSTYGHDMGSVATGIVTHPGTVASAVVAADRRTYYWQLLLPLGFLPVVALPFGLASAPQGLLNVLSSFPGTRDIRFQYSAAVLVGLEVALVEALRWLRRWRVALAVALVALAAGAVAGNVWWSVSPLGRPYRDGAWAAPQPRAAALDAAVASVPADAGVSTTYTIVSHLTHRRVAYEWPNPWIVGNWGIRDEHGPSPDTVDYLVLDLRMGQEPALLARLLDGPDAEFERVSERAGVLVARRIRRPAR
jgi:uncharacterized membrane protein